MTPKQEKELLQEMVDKTKSDVVPASESLAKMIAYAKEQRDPMMFLHDRWAKKQGGGGGVCLVL